MKLGNRRVGWKQLQSNLNILTKSLNAYSVQSTMLDPGRESDEVGMWKSIRPGSGKDRHINHDDARQDKGSDAPKEVQGAMGFYNMERVLKISRGKPKN